MAQAEGIVRVKGVYVTGTRLRDEIVGKTIAPILEPLPAQEFLERIRTSCRRFDRFNLFESIEVQLKEPSRDFVDVHILLQEKNRVSAKAESWVGSNDGNAVCLL